MTGSKKDLSIAIFNLLFGCVYFINVFVYVCEPHSAFGLRAHGILFHQKSDGKVLWSAGMKRLCGETNV